MLRNYFKTAWRNITQNKTFTIINVLGLALGLCSSILIFLWVQSERKVDSFHVNKKQLYQVYERNIFDGNKEASYLTQGLLAGELKKAIPEIEYASGFEFASAPGTKNTFEAGNKNIKMSGMFASVDFLSMFSFHLIEGNTKTALNAPSSIAISRTMADNFFGSPDQAIGKTILFDNKENLLITAVFENISVHSSIQFDFLRSWTDFLKQNNWANNWGNTDPQTFVQLRKDAVALKVESKIKNFIDRYHPKQGGIITELALQPFGERYLYSKFKNGYIEGGRIEYVRLFSIIAAFILLIACINFMNLATARSVKRAKEVGVRKVVGALRSSLIGQFIGEAVIVSFLSILIAISLVAISLPAFNDLTAKQLMLPINEPYFWIGITGLALCTGLIAGSYPAFFMSSLNPVRVLKGSLKFNWLTIFFRKGLVVFQFTLSIILITATILIYKQIEYVQHTNLGYNHENLLYIPIEGNLMDKYNVFKQKALLNSGILDISKMRNSPTAFEHHTNDISWPGKDPNLNASFADGVTGYDFVKTMKVKLIAGRDFSKNFTDTGSFVLNETAVKEIGFKDPVGQNISWGNREGKVIGVLQDFHFNSLHVPIEPLILRLDENWNWGTILIRIKAGKSKQAIEYLQNICKELNPQFPFTYQFSDLEYTNLYKSEELISKLTNIFAFLAIFISCLGLFGLTMFTVEQRQKEIGIRKILGASARNIINLLSLNIIKLVGIAFLIAFPFSLYVMNEWLKSFYYHISISGWVFLVVGLLAALIALLTISSQAFKAAFENPVKSLRNE